MTTSFQLLQGSITDVIHPLPRFHHVMDAIAWRAATPASGWHVGYQLYFMGSRTLLFLFRPRAMESVSFPCEKGVAFSFKSLLPAHFQRFPRENQVENEKKKLQFNLNILT